MIWMWALAGCTSLEEQDALWMRGAYFDWDLFNHRVSVLRFGFAGDEAEFAVVGGTSTTATPADLDDACDPMTCQEFPFADTSRVRLGWGRIVTDDAALGTATVSLDVPQQGASESVTVELPASPSGEVTALITGFSLDTDHPLSGETSCYRPEYGWHPRNFGLFIDDVTLDGKTATVEVTARFAPGITLEVERECIDEVFERSVVTMTVDVLVLAGVDAVSDGPVFSEATYTYGNGPLDPDPQEEVGPTALDISGTIVGWAGLDFAFDSGDDRGSYLRSFGFEIGDGGAAGIATNFSPLTQLTPFAYTFEGMVRAVELEGTVETGTVQVDELEPTLDGNEDAVLQSFPR